MIWLLLAIVIVPVVTAAVCACVVGGWVDEGMG